VPELKNRPVLIRSVNLLWYPVALVPILLLGYAGLAGWLPGMTVALAIFALIFWLFSLIFAIVALLRKPKELRQ
jgi:uncharacterized membrane protein